MTSIRVTENGPYEVPATIRLRRMTFVVADRSEDQEWTPGDEIPTQDRAGDGGFYYLCRCGESSHKPFCDGTHAAIGFDGTETADRVPYLESARLRQGNGIVLRDKVSLCQHSGFCMADGSDVWHMIHEDDAQVATAEGMVRLCPSGRLTLAPDADAALVEQDLPAEIAVVDDGCLLLTGGLPHETADGEPYEVRNRVTLCRCGASTNKPYCDGTHSEIGFSDH